ncbi:MAG: hypothetical protein WDN75_19680 [Bacteroidota bacterium]
MEQQEKNKNVVKRFNKELIEDGNAGAAKDLFHEDFINHSARAGSGNGARGMIMTFNGILRPGHIQSEGHHSSAGCRRRYGNDTENSFRHSYRRSLGSTRQWKKN